MAALHSAGALATHALCVSEAPTTVLLLAIAYVCGSIPTGVLLSRRRGVDPRDIGSGNIGATNVARAAGVTTGVLTLVGDVLKGLVPVVLALRSGCAAPTEALTGLAAFFGHLYSCFLGFQGGKGVATALGVSLGLSPLATAIVVPVFVVTAALSRYVSLASLVGALTLPPVVIVLGYPPATVVASFVMAAMITIRHRDNIRRLRHGTESRIGGLDVSRADSGVA